MARLFTFALFWIGAVLNDLDAADTRFAHSDSNARYVHHIDLYDAKSRKITPDSTTPYSSVKTCGRCHDYDTISHGWHFNAFDPNSKDGRGAEPWIWSDARTGTQLPLTYRDWQNGFDPKKLGISPFEMTQKFGGRLPGGGVGALPSQSRLSKSTNSKGNAETESDTGDSADDEQQSISPRWAFSGSLDVDCMVCHAMSGAYDFNARRDQVEQENFAWAPTAALRLGQIDGNVSRIKDDADLNDEATQGKLPKVAYDASRFSADGTVFMDLVRQPPSNSCYQCHSFRTVSDQGVEPRWNHDEDVHIRAGMDCADCHRNGIDHHIVRGFPGEENPSQSTSQSHIETLSCAGCHLGTDHADADAETNPDIIARAGRLGSPKPLHAGLPPLHFEKLTCTACHGGPVPREQALGVMTSLSHGLGTKDHRSGKELPLLSGPVYSKNADGVIAPHRVMWPAYFANVSDGKANPIAPSKVYDLTRRALRVRKSFQEDLLQPKLGSKEMKELLGDDRYRIPEEERTEEEQKKVAAARTAAGIELFNEKVYAALEAIEEELKIEQAGYVSAGFVYVRGDKEDTLKKAELKETTSIDMVQWPTAHNVRPAGWSLGVGGCVECHDDSGKIFASTVTATGPGPDSGAPVTMGSLQGLDPDQRLAWNELFKGRKTFKYIVGGSITVLLMLIMVGIGAFAGRLVSRKNATA